MKYFFVSMIVLTFVLVVAPFCLFPKEMDDYGSYLTGLAAIGAALKFVMPYLLIFLFGKKYSNELIWHSFLKVSSPDNEKRVLETEWIGGIIEYFSRCEESLHMGNPWYNKLPYLSDELSWEFGDKQLEGKKEKKLFEEIKSLIFESAEIVSMNSTPEKPIVKEEKYQKLHNKFKQLVQKTDEMDSLLVKAPTPVKKIIDGDDFYKSFLKQ